MADWKEQKRIFDEVKRVEREADELSRRLGIPDELTRWKADADERAAATEVETRRRLRQARHDQRERERAADVDARIAAAIAHEREVMEEAIGTAMGQFVKSETSWIVAKLKELETLLERLQSALDRHALAVAEREPSLRSRDVN